MTAFKSVVLDVDSTVCAVEGIDWLAEQRDASIAASVSALTADAMESRVPLDDVYDRRLAIIGPTRDEIAQLAQIYIETAMPGAKAAIGEWRAAGVRVLLVSGGLRDAILPLAEWLCLTPDDVYAVEIEYNDHGVAVAARRDAALARRGGKPLVVSSLALLRPMLAVGDGATDAELAPIVDCFLAFTGVARRTSVVERAADEVTDFASLTPIVLGS